MNLVLKRNQKPLINSNCAIQFDHTTYTFVAYKAGTKFRRKNADLNMHHLNFESFENTVENEMIEYLFRRFN